MDVLSLETTINSRTSHIKLRKNRKEVSNNIMNLEETLKQMSQRSAAKSLGIPRNTLRYWYSRRSKIELPKNTVAFFESPEGVAFLHQLVTAMLFVMIQLGNCGIRLMSLLLKLCQLDKFVASSYGSIQKLSMQMEKEILVYGQQEQDRLSKEMPLKKITICADETFHKKPCLVAIEPVSNFILTEEYSEKRDAAAWSSAMKNGLENLAVEIVQSTSDEGTGLLRYVKKELGGHHSPDLFHVQQELTRATSMPLNAKISQAEKVYKDSCEQILSLEKEKDRYIKLRGIAHHIAVFNKRITNAKTKNAEAFSNLESCKERKKKVKEAKKALGDAYHPYSLETGVRKTVEEIEEELEKQYLIIRQNADEAGLSERCYKHLEKAHRVFNKMVSTMSFFEAMVNEQVSELMLPSEQEEMMKEILIPAFYLKAAARKSKGAEYRHKMAAKACEMLNNLETADQLWRSLDEKKRNKIKTVAENCAQIFQRSSSCTEGRNGYLTLRHHSLHKLSTRKLKVLTLLHNYYIKRIDGTTAAERFFKKKPRDLFKFLLERFPYPARPAASRRKLAV